MSEINETVEYQQPPVREAAAAPRRRWRFAALAVPVGIAAMVGVTFTVLAAAGSTSQTPQTKTTNKVVNAAYTIERKRDGWVTVELTGHQLPNQATLRADFERVGVPAKGLFILDPNCHKTPPPARIMVTSVPDLVLVDYRADGTPKTLHINPAGIPAGYKLEGGLTQFTRDSHGRISLPYFQVTSGPLPECLPVTFAGPPAKRSDIAGLTPHASS